MTDAKANRKPPTGGNRRAALHALTEFCREHPEIVARHARGCRTATSSTATAEVRDARLKMLAEMGFIVMQRTAKARLRGRHSSLKDRIALTDAGRDLLRTVVDLGAKLAPVMATQTLRPHWDAQSSELQLGNILLKRFRRSADNQQLLLQAFEESDWAQEIDDPLPPHGRVQAMNRLRDTVKNLNRSLLVHVLEFGVTHHGTRVTWHLR